MSDENRKEAEAIVEKWVNNQLASESAYQRQIRLITAIQQALDARVALNPDKALIEKLADVFVAWPLPDSVCSDQCATIPYYRHYRSGTNLLTVTEARQMFEYCLSKVQTLDAKTQANEKTNIPDNGLKCDDCNKDGFSSDDLYSTCPDCSRRHREVRNALHIATRIRIQKQRDRIRTLEAEQARKVQFSEDWLKNPDKRKPETFEEWSQWMDGFNQCRINEIKLSQELEALKKFALIAANDDEIPDVIPIKLTLKDLFVIQTTLERIKLACLTMKNPQKGLAYIIRLCLDAGVEKKLNELQEKYPNERKC